MIRPFAALALAVTAALLAASPASPGPHRTTVVRQVAMPEPAYLPVAARALLHERMARHRDEQALLTSSALLLAYPEIEVAAGELAGEPQLARPGPDERDTLNASLPRRFFDLQEELVQRARTLRAAAAQRDGAAVARAYGQVAETCVACHAVYLRGE